MSEDEWHQAYQEVTQDLYQAIAQQLIIERQNDEAANYELNERFSEQQIESQVATLDPCGQEHGMSVCALCHHGMVHKVGLRRLACEVPGCLDIVLPFDYTLYRAEDVMN